MRRRLATTTLVILASPPIALRVHAQASAPSPFPGVTMTIEAPKNPIRIGDDLSIKVMIANNTNEFLSLSFVPSLSSFLIHIHDAEGNTPKETDEGCKRHQSAWCANERQNGGSGSMQFLYVLPGKKTSIDVDVSLEYLLNYPSTFTIDIAQEDFIAFDAPPKTNFYLLGNFPHQNLGHLKSNSINVQVAP